MHLTKLKDNRLQHILVTLEEGRPFVERRGGDRVSKNFESKKNSVRNFTGNLQGTESHYNRNKSKRIYLQGDLSIKKLCNIYNSLQVTPNFILRFQCSERYFAVNLISDFVHHHLIFMDIAHHLTTKLKPLPLHKNKGYSLKKEFIKRGLSVFMTLCVNLLNSMNQKCVLICNKCSHYLAL